MDWTAIFYFIWMVFFYTIGAISEYLRLNPLALWSFGLAAIGILGIYLAGSKNKLGWVIGFLAQILWIVYGVLTHQHGFIFSALGYAWVYARNFKKWLKEQEEA